MNWFVPMLILWVFSQPFVVHARITNVVATADVLACSGWPNQNFGSYGQLLIGYSANSEAMPNYPDPLVMRSYLKFDLRNALPPGVPVTNMYEARLKLWFLGSNSRKHPVVDINAVRLTNNWSEAGLVWSSKPGGVGVVGTTNWVLISTEGLVEVPLSTTVVRNWISNPGSNYGVEISSTWAEAHGLFLQFASREDQAHARPILQLTYTEPTYFGVSGRVTSRNWPYGGVGGVLLSADTGENVVTTADGRYAFRLPTGTRRITASRIDYEAAQGTDSAWVDIDLRSDLGGVDFSNFACKAVPAVSISMDTNVVAPGQTFNVRVTMQNAGPGVANVDGNLALSFSTNIVSAGAPTSSNWDGQLSSYPPGSIISSTNGQMTSQEYLVLATRTNSAWDSTQTYSFTVPLTVVDTITTGTIVMKVRGGIGDRLDPSGPDAAFWDQQGWPVWVTNVIVIKPLQILSHQISTTNTRDGQTFTLSYEVYSPSDVTGWFGCRLEGGSGEVVEDERHEPPKVPLAQIFAGTNWYSREFFVNLGPRVGPGLYDVSWTIHQEGGKVVSAKESQFLSIDPPIPIRIPILMYHKVGPIAYSSYWVSTENFWSHMRALKAYGYSAITMEQLIEARAGLLTLPDKPVVLTFDDGNASLLTDVFPILSDASVNYKATSFILTGKVGLDSTWDNDCCYIGRQLTWDEIQGLHETGYIDFESHGVNHPYYVVISEADVANDLTESKQALEEHLGKTIVAIAYPYGFYNITNQLAVREAGYFCALTAWGGLDTNCADKYAIKRVGILDTTSVDYDPDWSPDFFFSFDESFPVPVIAVESIDCFDVETGELLPDHQGVPGERVMVRLLASNDGAATEVRGVLRIDPDGDPSNGLIYDSHAVSPSEDVVTRIEVGLQTFTWSWTVPSNAPAGNYSLLINFRDTNDVLSFLTTGWVPAFEVLSPPSVTNVFVELNNGAIGGAVVQGGTISGSGVITGISRGVVEYYWKVLQPDGGEWSSDLLSVMMTNGMATIPAYTNLPTSLLGAHTVWIRVASPGEPTDTLSNTQSYNVLEPLPDLLISGQIGIERASQNAGETTLLQVEVENGGNVVVTNEILVRAYLSAEGLLAISNRISLGAYVISNTTLLPGQSFAVQSWGFSTPSDLPTADYYLWVEVDPESAIAELHDDNNTQSLYPFHVEELRPDLRAVSVSLTGVFEPAVPRDVSYEIANIGTAGAGGFGCRIVLSTNPAIDNTAALLASFPLAGLEKTQTLTGTVTVNLPDWLERNTNYYLGLIVDYAGVPPNPAPGEVLEMPGHEVDNNTCYEGVMWQPPPVPLVDALNTTPGINEWSRSNQMDVWWTMPPHPFAITGYSVLLDDSPTNCPEPSITTTNQNWLTNAVSDSAGLYLHIRAQDELGQWSTAAHLGPFKIDTTAPSLPNLMSPTNEQNVAGLTPTFTWSQATDNLSSVSYELKVLAQVDPDFEVQLLERLHEVNLAFPSYTPEQAWTLSGQRVLWAVRAADTAGNMTDWTPYAGFTAMDAAGSVELVVPYYEQERYEHGWGWAAGAAMVLKYYGYGLKPWEAAAAFGKGMAEDISPIDLLPWLQTNYGTCETNTWALEQWNPFSKPVLISTLAHVLSQGNPVLLGRTPCTNWSWPPEAGGDAIVVVGYSGLNLDDSIYYHDPSTALAFGGGIKQSVTWKDFIDLVNSKWLDRGDIRIVFSTCTNLQPVTIPATLALLPGSICREPGLAWNHIVEGTNYSAVLQWDGGTDWTNGYYFFTGTPGEFPSRTSTITSNYVVLGVTKRDSLSILSYIANSSSNTIYVRLAGRIVGGSNDSPVLSFSTGDLKMIAPYTAGNRSELQLVENLGEPEIEPGVPYKLELVLLGNVDGSEVLETWDTNHFAFNVESWPMGGVQVLLGPDEAISTGAAWRLDNGSWQTNGTTISCLSTGRHLLEYQNLDGWTAPAAEQVEVTDGQTNIASRAYVQGGTVLQVMLLPASAVAAGAQWRLDGQEWLQAGQTVNGLSPGDHLVEFKEVPEWRAPTNETISVISNRLITLVREYISKTGTLVVTMSPEAANFACAFWQLDGSGVWHRSGESAASVTVGLHQLTFREMPGWSMPEEQAVLISEGETNEISVAYTRQTGGLAVAISSANTGLIGAQWRMDDGPWRDPDYVASDVPTGMHQIDFSSLSGWRRPASQFVAVSAGETTAVQVLYVQKVAPIVASQPQSQMKLAGSTVSFVVSAGGTDPLSYQWRKGGVDIIDDQRTLGATGSSLTVAGLTYTDAGNYTVVVSNAYGLATSEVAVLTIPNRVVVWGENAYGQTNIPPECSNAIAIAAGSFHCLALRADGVPVAWGKNADGEGSVPAGLTNVVGISAGSNHNLALRSDGMVIGWGNNDYGQTNVPPGLTNVQAVAAGDGFSVALKADGTIVSWGRSDWDLNGIWRGASNLVAVSAGGSHVLALKANGLVVAWGNDEHGQATPPAGLSNVVSIAAGARHSLALLESGRVIAWGDNQEGQGSAPADLGDVAAIASGTAHSLALRTDGTVQAWGSRENGQTNPPAWLSGVSAVAARGGTHSMALMSDGSPFVARAPWSQVIQAGAMVTLKASAIGVPPFSYQWLRDGIDLSDDARFAGTQSPVLSITGLQPADAGAFSVVISNSFGMVTSAVAFVAVSEPAWQWVQRFGASSNIVCTGIAVDSLGNVYSTGIFEGTAELGSNSLTSAGTSDVFVVKTDNVGRILWSLQAGVTGQVAQASMALDEDGKLFIAVTFTGSVVFGTNTLSSSNEAASFLAEFNEEGAVVWAVQVGESKESINGIASDRDGNVYVTGTVASTNGLPEGTITNLALALAKYDSSGNRVWRWQNESVTTGTLVGQSVASDGVSNLYMLGKFNGVVELGTNHLESPMGQAAFVAKFDPTGQVTWAKPLTNIAGQKLALDSMGIIYITGLLTGDANLGTNSFLAAQGLILAKFDNAGEIVWAQTPEGQFTGYELVLAIDAHDHVFVQGRFEGELQLQKFTLWSPGRQSYYVAEYDTTGECHWIKQIEAGLPSEMQAGSAVALDTLGNLYCSGNFGVGSLLATYTQGGTESSNSFLAKMELTGPILMSQLSGQVVRFGQNVGFAIEASGTGVTYEWRKDDAALPADNLRITGTRSNRLEIANVELSDAAFYSVVVSDAFGVITSGVARVTVVGFVQSLVDNAPVGATVAIPQGLFSENLRIEKDLVLQGAGKGATILNGNGSGSVITVSSNCSVEMTELCVTGGRAEAGGGIWNAGTLRLASVLCVSNSAGGIGGAILNNGVLTLSNSTVLANSALEDGGVANFGQALLQNCTVGLNNSSRGAGGIYSAAGASVALTNCTISGNACELGPGGFHNNGMAAVSSCTVCSNTSFTGAGGIDNIGTIQLRNSIVAGNQGAASNAMSDLGGDFLSEGFNLIGGTNGFNLIGVNNGNLLGQDPLLGPLADNGGPTLTHALLEGSPAIDQGRADGLGFDQRGLRRPENFPQIQNAGDGADMGAFERVVDYEPPSILVQSGSQWAMPGSEVTFTVQASGNPPLHYQWQFNGMDLVDDGIVAGANSPSLVLSNAQPYCSGAYTLVVTNYAGAFTSEVQQLTITNAQASLRYASISSNGLFSCSFFGVEGQRYSLEETTNLVDWTEVLVLTNGIESVQLVQAAPVVPGSHFYRTRALPQIVEHSSDPGPTLGSGFDRTYDDGYVKVDSLGNAAGKTYYWGYDLATQNTGEYLLFHSRGLIDTRTVRLITDKYPLNGMVPPSPPYRGEFTVPEQPTPEHPPLQGAPPVCRTISLY